MTEELNERGGRPQWLGYAVLVVVAAIVVAGGAWLFLGGGDDGEAQSDPFANITPPANQTPISEAPGAPTPLPDTGVLDPQRPELGEPAPDFALASARDTDEIIRLSDFHGTPIVLNWYASWCGPCEEEIPAFQSAYEQVGQDNVVFFGVNYLESPEKAQSILDNNGATFPAVLDTNGAVSDHWRVQGLPTTYFIDADGNVVDRQLAPISEEELAEKLSELDIEWTPESS